MIIPIDRFSRSGATPLPLRSPRLLGLAVLAILGAACAILLAMRGAPVVWLFDPHGDFTDF